MKIFYCKIVLNNVALIFKITSFAEIKFKLKVWHAEPEPTSFVDIKWLLKSYCVVKDMSEIVHKYELNRNKCSEHHTKLLVSSLSHSSPFINISCCNNESLTEIIIPGF